MNNANCSDLVIAALEMAICDAISYPDLKLAKKSKELTDRASELAVEDGSISVEEKNSTRVLLILYRAIWRYLSRSVPSEADYDRDIDSFKKAISQKGVKSADSAAALDILTFFSDAAREYAIANPISYNTSEVRPELEALRRKCVENSVKLVRRSIAQRIAAESRGEK